MPYWTTQEIVLKHIQAIEPAMPNIYNERLILISTAFTQMAHTNIDTNSEVVKICQLNEPYYDVNNPLTLSGTSPVNLKYGNLVWGSIVVADDAFLSTIYVVNKDYTIDYVTGTITRVSSGSISSGQAVHVWYLYFKVFSITSDYLMDYDAGQIRRSLGSQIPLNATIFIDYAHSQPIPTTEIIDEAIQEAEAWMLERLLPEYTSSSTDQGLTSAATYFALVIICLSEAFKETMTGRDSSDTLSKQWQELAAKYDNIGVLYFQRYSQTVNVNSGGLIQNRNKGANYQRKIQSPSVSPRFRKR